MQAYRAPSLFQPHNLRKAFADAHAGRIPPMVGFYISLAGPTVTKLVAQLGFDLAWIDWEHTSMGVETMTQMVHDIQFMSEGRTVPMVRVPGHDHAAIGFALDAGASIIIPQVETVEDARHVASAAKFGRKYHGTRSMPPARFVGPSAVTADASRSLPESLNHQAALMIQVETEEAVNNLDAILTEVGEHIDTVWLGMLDCRVSMGLPPNMGAGDEPEWLAVKDKFVTTMKKHNKPISGMALGTLDAAAAEGKSGIFVASDVFAILGEVEKLQTARAAFPTQDWTTE